MLLRQIQFFVSIVDENSFTEAAEKNYVSQSAISQTMNAMNDQRRAFSDDYVNMELKNAECIIELSERSELSSNERLEVADLVKMSCIIVSSKEQRETEAEYYRDILGFANDFLYAETQEEARLMVIGSRGFLPVAAWAKKELG